LSLQNEVVEPPEQACPIAFDPTNIPTSRPTDPPFTPPQTGCDPNWRDTRRAFNANLANWTDPQCYNYIFTRIGRPSVGPISVEVRDGRVTSPILNPRIPTMEILFNTIRRWCFRRCPEIGAEICELEYGDFGTVSDVFIDISTDRADEELIYEIREFEIC